MPTRKGLVAACRVAGQLPAAAHRAPPVAAEPALTPANRSVPTGTSQATSGNSRHCPPQSCRPRLWQNLRMRRTFRVGFHSCDSVPSYGLGRLKLDSPELLHDRFSTPDLI